MKLETQDPRIEQILDLIFQFASGNLSARGELTESGDELDAIFGGLNMLAEELEASITSLEQTRTYLKNIIESMVDILIIVNPDATIQGINPATIRLLGYEEAELKGKPIGVIFKEEQVLFHKTGIEDLIRKGGVQDVELTCFAKDGRRIPVLFSGSVMRGEDDSIQGVVCVIQDITERKQAEEEHLQLEAQLRQAQRLEAIGTLAGGIAHDFNNILGTILGYTELLLKEQTEGSKAKKCLEQVYQAGERATDLVRQILAYSSSQELQLTPTDIVPIIEEVLKMMRATIPTNIDIRQNVQPNSRPILADATQIHQVILNLCVNAYHAMREQGGTLDVTLEEVVNNSTNQVYIPGLTAGSYLNLTVSDTGCGMTPDVQEHIFEPFFTTKEIGEGAGLGLSVVYGIVKGHNGVITVESEPEKGTTFQIFFPTTDEIEPQGETAKTHLVRRGQESILIVDDEPALIELYELALTQLGYHVTVLTNSYEALEIFRAKPDQFDLVFTDQAMPGMTGDQMSREFLHIRPGIPIVLMTGHSDTISEKEAKALGIRHFLMKPVKIGTLIEVIQKIFT